MEKEPLVSVIIPTYNRAKVLPHAITSVLKQTYKNFEVIVVDDKSGDNTVEVLRKLKKKDNRIKYHLNSHNKGVSGARNIGIERAKGDYIAFLDDDDAYKKDHLKDAVELFSLDSKIKFIFCNTQGMDASYYRILHKITRFAKKLNPKYYVYKKPIDVYLLEFGVIFPSVIIASTTSLKKNKFDLHFDLVEDLELAVRLVRNCKVGFINKKNVIRHFEEEGFGRSKNDEHMIDIKKRELILRIRILEKNKYRLTKKQIHHIKNKLCVEYYCAIGWLYLQTKRFKKAKEYYIKSLRSHLNLAAVKGLLKTSKDEAIQKFSQKPV